MITCQLNYIGHQLEFWSTRKILNFQVSSERKHVKKTSDRNQNLACKPTETFLYVDAKKESFSEMLQTLKNQNFTKNIKTNQIRLNFQVFFSRKTHHKIWPKEKFRRLNFSLPIEFMRKSSCWKNWMAVYKTEIWHDLSSQSKLISFPTFFAKNTIKQFLHSNQLLVCARLEPLTLSQAKFRWFGVLAVRNCYF